MRSCSSLASYQNNNQNGGVQLSELKFLNANNSSYTIPMDKVPMSKLKFNGVKMHQTSELTLSELNTGEFVGRLFDGSTSTKLFCYTTGTLCKISVGTDTKPATIYDDNENALIDYVNGVPNNALWQQCTGVNSMKMPPCLFILDVTSNPLDVSMYNQWCFYNGNDNASQPHRTWVEGEIMGSVNLKTWWQLDAFNDITIPNTNYACAYTGNLIPRKGDAWSDLDLAERNWINGISTN